MVKNFVLLLFQTIKSFGQTMSSNNIMKTLKMVFLCWSIKRRQIWLTLLYHLLFFYIFLSSFAKLIDKYAYIHITVKEIWKERKWHLLKFSLSFISFARLLLFTSSFWSTEENEKNFKSIISECFIVLFDIESHKDTHSMGNEQTGGTNDHLSMDTSTNRNREHRRGSHVWAEKISSINNTKSTWQRARDMSMDILSKKNTKLTFKQSKKSWLFFCMSSHSTIYQVFHLI